MGVGGARHCPRHSPIGRRGDYYYYYYFLQRESFLLLSLCFLSGGNINPRWALNSVEVLFFLFFVGEDDENQSRLINMSVWDPSRRARGFTQGGGVVYKNYLEILFFFFFTKTFNFVFCNKIIDFLVFASKLYTYFFLLTCAEKNVITRAFVMISLYKIQSCAYLH